MKQPAWTYSQLEKFETCPKQFYHVRVIKDVVEPQGEHAEWGTRVHSAMEEYLLHKTPLPEGMTQWQGIAEKFAHVPGKIEAERKFAIDRNFQPCDWSEAWSRGIADFVAIHKDRAVIADWKTGKKKPTEQLALYATYVFHYHPEVQRVQTAFVWLKDRKLSKDTITREQVPVIWNSLLPRARKLEAAYEREVWPAKPSGLCRGWCAVKSCPHWKPKR